MWKLPLTGRAAELLDNAMLLELCDNEPGLKGVFVRGASAMLTENIQPTKFLVNGAYGHMHSLSFSEKAREELTPQGSRPGFRHVILDEPPLSINCQAHSS